MALAKHDLPTLGLGTSQLDVAHGGQRMTHGPTSYELSPMAPSSYDVITHPQRGEHALARGLVASDHVGMRKKPMPVSHADARRLRRHKVEELAAEQSGIVSRRQLYAVGITRGEVSANIRADRWRRVGRQSVSIHRAPLTVAAQHWAAVHEAGPRAYLDAGSALIAAGLRGFDVPKIRVSVPRGARVWRVRGLDIRQTRRWTPEDLASGPLRRSRPEVAAVRQALWSRTDREAALVLTMTVQQRLATAEEIAHALLAVRRDRRRAFVHKVALDLLGGVRSLGELDVLHECRRRGLPTPDQQAVRRGRNGTYYLDFVWSPWRVVVEVDGIQHSWAAQIVGDAIRQNDVTLQGMRVLRLPLLGLRVAPDDFFDQIEAALRQAGWQARRTA
jgi:very-short-patch-repair endonuclease